MGNKVLFLDNLIHFELAIPDDTGLHHLCHMVVCSVSEVFGLVVSVWLTL